MAEREEQFRTSLMGGFDKQDVDEQFQQARENAAKESGKLRAESETRERELARLNARVEELTAGLEKKEREADTLRADIDGKYKSYIDNFDMIGRLANESREKAEEIRQQADQNKARTLADAAREAQQIREDAEADARRIKEEAGTDAQKMRDDARRTVEDQRAEGQAKYEAAQEELTGVVEQFGRIQHQFMQSYKTIQEITNK